jgi:hypothetical protein
MTLFMDLIIDAAVFPGSSKAPPLSFVFIRPCPAPLALALRPRSRRWRHHWSFVDALPNGASAWPNGASAWPLPLPWPWLFVRLMGPAARSALLVAGRTATALQ